MPSTILQPAVNSISVSRAIELLSECVAVTVDSTRVVYPNVDDNEDSPVFLRLEQDDFEESFSLVRNEIVQLTSDGGMVLISDAGEPFVIILLTSVAAKAA